MLKIDTSQVEVNATSQVVFDHLADFTNFNSILPEDKIENWQSDKDSCSFRIKGMTEIGMKIEERKPHEELKIVSHGKVPFPFTLWVKLSERENGCNASMTFEGDANAFLKMMVEKPLTNFFEMLIQALKARYEA